MIVRNLRRDSSENRARLVATVIWEKAARPPTEIEFSVDASRADMLTERADAFAIGALVPAWEAGERRLRIEASLDPRLEEGLAAISALYREWKMFSSPAPEVEAAESGPVTRAGGRQAGLFVSGGVDSTFSLYRNRERFAPAHPSSIRAGVFVESLPFPEGTGSPRADDLARRCCEALSAIAADTGIEIVPVRTNLRSLDSRNDLYTSRWYGMVLAAVGHALAARFRVLTIATAHDAAAGLPPSASHPWLDPLFSSSDLEYIHDGFLTSRGEKIAALAGHDAAVRNLQVCFESPLPTGILNCGACEKCLRTMVELELADCLERAVCFPRRTICAEDIRAVTPAKSDFRTMWTPAAEAMRRKGREDLAAAIEEKLIESRRIEEWYARRGWKGALRRLDERLFRGGLARLRKKLRGHLARRIPK